MRPPRFATDAANASTLTPADVPATPVSASARAHRGISNGAATAAHAPVNFTFVNQAEDVASLASRKISNQQQRHAIRSHVMQRVRQEEQALGKRRSVGRDGGGGAGVKRPALVKSPSRSSDSDSSVKQEPRSPPYVDVKSESHEPGVFTIADNGTTGTTGPADDVDPANALEHRGEPPPPRLPVSPATHEIDPFDSLPTNAVPHKSTESLLQYCFDVMLPLTFSVASQQPRERLARQAIVLQSKISNPAAFLGFMATAAAHRAIYYGHHRDLGPSQTDHDSLITDPAYKQVKHEALVAVRKHLSEADSWDHTIIEACFALISTATVVGNFEEARIHLAGVAKLVPLMERSADAMKWIPISIVKVAVGLLSRPVVDLPWRREPMPASVLRRVAPDPASDMARVGTDFESLAALTGPLQSVLSAARPLCHLCERSAADARGLSPLEHAVLGRTATEVEFDLLAYPYDSDVFGRGSHGDPVLPPTEQLIRLAALGFLSLTPHTILPSTGLGRALTHRQQQAVLSWRRTAQASCGVAETRAVMWAMFVFARNAAGQPEERFFQDVLSQLSRTLWLTNWADVETTLFGFLYIPSLQSALWESLWTSACRFPRK